MELFILLIFWAALVAAVIPLLSAGRWRSVAIYTGAGGMMVLAVAGLLQWLAAGGDAQMLYVNTALLDHGMLVADFLIMGLLVYLSIKYKKYPVALLSVAQTVLLAYTELAHPTPPAEHILLDPLSILMCLIAALVGGAICIYSVGYMKAYHAHHTDVRDRSAFFFAMLFLFLSAMFGLVLSANLVWMYFFWEITSVVSFLLIGYTRTEEAVRNSFRALWMNLLGGLGFAIAIAVSSMAAGTVQLDELVGLNAVIPVALLAFAGLTKSAQMPFSSWLLGAMVAPTPSSALLHSATMVKAGVYLLIRLAPAMAGTLTGLSVSIIGGFTFIFASVLAISQSDGKKVLAFSTVSNLGLIVACAGVGVKETVWAALLLLIFHALSKSLLFQVVGAVENSLGSRNIEDMHGLLLRLPKLAYLMGIGIAGMYLAPFGMLISKWVALKSFVDANNIVLVLFVAFGSGTTMLYWTKWLSKLISLHHTRVPTKDITRRDQYFSMFLHAVAMLLFCLFLPQLASYAVNPMIEALFGVTEMVLSMDTLTTMAIMLLSILIVPGIMLLVTRDLHRDYVPTYMSGVNVGDNSHFVGSLKDREHLFLANWYLGGEHGADRLMRPMEVLAGGVLATLLCVIIGGAI
ncbi:MAG: proton-conducting transporter membrane subunit [Oscillibacter sp.]